MLRRTLVWEENAAPLNPYSSWESHEGAILDISWDKKAFWIRDHATGALRWVDSNFDIHRSVAIKIERKPPCH